MKVTHVKDENKIKHSRARKKWNTRKTNR